MSIKSIFRLLLISLAVLICAVILAPAGAMAAEAPVDLGTTENFAVLAGTTVTNTGATVISGTAGGDVGVSPGTAITGFPPGITSGTIHLNDAVASQAQTDLETAYNDAASRTVTQDLTGQDLGGLTLTSGVYSFDTSAQLTGTLTLDAEGNPDAAFIFQIGSTLTTASASSISLINGAQYCRVFWQVGSSATLGTNTEFIGHIFALTSITANTGATVQGQLLAREGAVTLDTNTITNGVCAAPTPTPIPTLSPTPTPTLTPTPTPTLSPIPTPTTAPTPTLSPIPTPTTAPALSPTPTPTLTPISTPSLSPTLPPTTAPTPTSTFTPTSAPITGSMPTTTLSPTSIAPTSISTQAPTPTTTTVSDSEIPQTAETDSYGFIALILLGITGGAALYLRRVKSR